jgi:RNA polymerase sigma-70 factor (ECF subfamily)
MRSKYLKNRFNTSKEELKRLGNEFTSEALPILENLYEASFWILLDKKSTEKIIKQVFTEAIEDCDITKNEADWQSWIYRIWIREILEFYSEKENDKNTEFSFIDDFKTEISAIQALINSKPPSEKIFSSLQKLPSVLRIPLIMREFLNFNYETISDLIDVPLGVAATRIYRARKLLTMFLLNNENNFEAEKNKWSQPNFSKEIFELRECSLFIDNELNENEKDAFFKSTGQDISIQTEVYIQSEMKKLLVQLADERLDTSKIKADIYRKASKRFNAG